MVLNLSVRCQLSLFCRLCFYTYSSSRLFIKSESKISFSNNSALLTRKYDSIDNNEFCLLINLDILKLSDINLSSTIKMSEYPFCVEYDKRGAAKCKKCKIKIDKGMLRIGRIGPNPFGEGVMKHWHHAQCMFEVFKRARATTKIIEDPSEDIEGWQDIKDDDKQLIKKFIEELQNEQSNKTPNKKKQTPLKPVKAATPVKSEKAYGIKDSDQGSLNKKLFDDTQSSQSSNQMGTTSNGKDGFICKDNSFKEFRRLCAKIAETSSYLSKTEVVSQFFKLGTNGEKFEGDLKLWVKLLLPGVVKRVYNLQSKQLVKLFSQIFHTNQEEMLEHLEQGDVAGTIGTYFEKSKVLVPNKKWALYIHEVDSFLDTLSGMTREDEQSGVLRHISQRCTSNDLVMIIRLIKGDLRINAGAKHILDGVHPDAYEAFQTTRNIDTVLDQVLEAAQSGGKGALKIIAMVMTPVLPMLAEACRSVEQAMKKCPNGMYAEIKYDGERVQVHKKGSNFAYFSRSLKPVLPHKVLHFKEYIPKAFPHGSDLILDAEVLLIDIHTGNPLPFGSLGIHKKSEFKDASVCLFVFDCLHYNGINLMDKSISERKKILEKNMTEVKNRIIFSEAKVIHKATDLKNMIEHVLKQGLEGLVLKDLNGIYEPGKRHWLKVKKDYVNEGVMADSADLVVLGAWYGTGKRGGMMSIFLMGCYDPASDMWCSVTKVHTGHDDARLEKLQSELDMVKISQDYDRIPDWLSVNRGLVPDFVAKDPKKSPVWEITGAEFTKNKVHTADGISIRFPRVTKERIDKSYEDATDLPRLKLLYEKSKEVTDITGLNMPENDDEATDDTTSINSSHSPQKLTPKKAYDYLSDASTSERKKKRRNSEQSSTLSSRKKLNRSDEDKSTDVNIKSNDKSLDRPTSNPLPSIFTGIKLCIPNSLEKAEELKRYFVAYDGDLLEEEHQHQEATHVIVVPGKKEVTLSSNQESVLVDWLWDSVKLQALQSCRRYHPKKM